MDDGKWLMVHEPSVHQPFLLRGPGDTAALDAIRANLNLTMRSVHQCVNDLQVRFEQTRRNRRYVLTDAALLLGLAASQDGVSAHIAFTANFTASRHDVTPFEFGRGRTIRKMSPWRQG